MSDSKTAFSICEAQDFHVSAPTKPAKDNMHINFEKHIELMHGVLLSLTF